MQIATMDGGQPLRVDLHALRGTHLGVIANSGAGKSGLIRRILESTQGEIQQIILDSDDEYYTLREGGDYVIAGGEDGDCPATVENAGALADMLLRTGISAVIQLNHLKGEGPQMFVAAFIDALMEAPRELWHPVLLVLDEAHRFIPQDGSTAATDAVRDLFARGRKRGFTGIVATQRMASVEKMVTANINNWALGRVGQATDRKVVLEMLGFTARSDEGQTLMSLPDRRFWFFGRGLGANRPVLGTVDTVATTIVESGQAKIPTRPPPEALKRLLEGLKAEPAPVTPAGGASAAHGPSQAEIEAMVNKARRKGEAHGYDVGYRAALDHVAADLESRRKASWPDGRREPDDHGERVEPPPARMAPSPKPPPAPDDPPKKVSRAVQAIVRFYESIYPRAVPFVVAARQAGVGLSSSQFRTYEPEMRSLGVVEDVGGGRYRALRQVGSPDEYLDAVEAQLAPKHKAVLKFIRRAGRPVTRDEIIHAADISPTSSTTSAVLALLMREAEVVEEVPGGYQLVEAYR